LLNIIIVVESPIPNTVECDCPFCGGKSAVTHINGKLFWGPISKSESNYPTTIATVDNTDFQMENGKIVGKGTWLVSVKRA